MDTAPIPGMWIPSSSWLASWDQLEGIVSFCQLQQQLRSNCGYGTPAKAVPIRVHTRAGLSGLHCSQPRGRPGGQNTCNAAVRRPRLHLREGSTDTDGNFFDGSDSLSERSLLSQWRCRDISGTFTPSTTEADPAWTLAAAAGSSQPQTLTGGDRRDSGDMAAAQTVVTCARCGSSGRPGVLAARCSH
jgi:hypothetical protein